MPRQILHVLPSLDEAYGGPLRLVLDLSARAEGARISSHVLGIGPISVRDNPLDASRVHSLPANFPAGYAYSRSLCGWLRERLSDFDGVVIHGAWTYAGWAAATECRRADVPYAYYPHGMLEKWAVQGQGFAKSAKKYAYWFWRERRVARSARSILFTTDREREYTMEVFRILAPMRILPPYGMDPEVKSVQSPDGIGIVQPATARVALFLGRLHRKKNIEFLLDAWQRAGMKAPWRLVIAGSGDAAYEASLRRMVETSNLGDSVRFTGFVGGRDKLYLLNRAEWFLLPSQQENFGIAVLEAIEQGCPVAISDKVYLAESFRTESEVLPLQSESWSEFMQTRMQDSEYRHRVGQKDRDHLLKHFTMDHIVNQWTEAFLELFPARR